MAAPTPAGDPRALSHAAMGAAVAVTSAASSSGASSGCASFIPATTTTIAAMVTAVVVTRLVTARAGTWLVDSIVRSVIDQRLERICFQRKITRHAPMKAIAVLMNSPLLLWLSWNKNPLK
jgi:hypothetical protein